MAHVSSVLLGRSETSDPWNFLDAQDCNCHTA